jgi:hypothetical protein
MSVRNTAAAALGHLEKIFGDRLYSEAERLVESGCVLDVRILQGGAVVTGVVAANAQASQPAGKHRVYIRRSDGRRSSGVATVGTAGQNTEAMTAAPNRW